MNRSRAVSTGKRTALMAVAVIAGVGTAAAVPAYASSDGPAGEPPTPQNMAKMQPMMEENPGMARMHELMMEGNPGMTRMHERMMERGAGSNDGQE